MLEKKKTIEILYQCFIEKKIKKTIVKNYKNGLMKIVIIL